MQEYINKIRNSVDNFTWNGIGTTPRRHDYEFFCVACTYLLDALSIKQQLYLEMNTQEWKSLTAATSTLFNRATLGQWHFLTRTVSCGLWRTHAVFNFSRHCHKRLFNISGILSASLQKRNTQGVGKFLVYKGEVLFTNARNTVSFFSELFLAVHNSKHSLFTLNCCNNTYFSCCVVDHFFCR